MRDWLQRNVIVDLRIALSHAARLPPHIRGLANPLPAIVRLLVEAAGAGRLQWMVARRMARLLRLRSSSAACAMCSAIRCIGMRTSKTFGGGALPCRLWCSAVGGDVCLYLFCPVVAVLSRATFGGVSL